MARRRFFVDAVQNGQAELEGDEARHLTQVLRVEAGEKYEISDNRQVYLAEVELARKQHVVFRILGEVDGGPDLVPVALYLPLIKFERLELALEKATELGVAEIHLVETERCEHGLEKAAPKRMTRWNRIILEASQQARRTHLPLLHEPVRLDSVLEADTAYRLFLDEARTGKTPAQLTGLPDAAAILVGPEGGFSENERARILSAGWQSTSLGPLILRTETAAIAALAALNSTFYGG